MLSFDHLAIACEDLDAASAALEARLGCSVSAVGHHDRFGTHNRLLSLGPDAYLELIAIDPDAPQPDRARWFALDRFSGPARVTNWITRVDDIGGALGTLGHSYGSPVQLSRGPYSWQMAVPDDGELPFDGAAPALIEWHGHAHPAAALPDRGYRLSRLAIQHPDAAELMSSVSSLLEDPRIEIRPGPLQFRAVLSGPYGEVVV